MKKAKAGLIITGIFSVIFALFGFFYNFMYLSAALAGAFSDLPDQFNNTSYFYPAFYTMSFICIVCYIILLTCGIQFIRLKVKMVKIFIGTLIFEVIYFFLIALFCRLPLPEISMSIAAATGVSSGGLTPQGVLLFPLWAPWVVYRSAKKIRQSE